MSFRRTQGVSHQKVMFRYMKSHMIGPNVQRKLTLRMMLKLRRSMP